MHLPALRFGTPYESLEKTPLVHFLTGELVAEVSQTGGAMLSRDLRHAQRARESLRAIDPLEMVRRLKKAGSLYAEAALPVGDSQQTPEDFVRQQSATTGLPETLCRANMQKNLLCFQIWIACLMLSLAVFQWKFCLRVGDGRNVVSS